jgi:putative metallohydrolase (TIGR04338 family)
MRTAFGGAGRSHGRNGERDSQRAKCYRAEDATSMSRIMQWGSRPDIATCQRFVDDVLSRPWAVKLWNRAPRFSTTTWVRGVGRNATQVSTTTTDHRSVRVTDNGGKRGSCASHHVIYVSTCHRNHMVMLHELAHCLTPDDVGHGREWARTYLLLVTKIMGAKAGAELRASFRTHKVKYREVTAAQRAAGARLAARGDGGAGLARWREEQKAAKEASPYAQAATS